MFDNNYLTLYVNSGLNEQSPTALMTLFLLAMMRLLPIVAFVPYFGAKLLPRPVKVCLALSLFLIFFPMLLQVTNVGSLGYTSYTWVLAVKEMFIGLIMGLLSTIPSYIVQGAGTLIDHQRGGASLQVQDPAMQNQSSPIGTVYDLVYIFLFWLIDAPFMMVDAIQMSFEIIPPDKLFNPFFFNQEAPFWKEIIGLFNFIMKTMVQLASPSLIVILMTDTFLGIANRLAPNVMITFLGMPLKSFLGIFIIWLGWKLLTSTMLEKGFQWMIHFKELVMMFGIGDAVPT